MYKSYLLFYVVFIYNLSLSASTVFYQVPVQDEQLYDASFYRIEDYNIKMVNNVYVMEYSLPLELTGNDEKLIFKSDPIDPLFLNYSYNNSQEILLKGKNGQVSCYKNLKLCNVKYSNLKINHEARTKKLLDLNLDPALLSKKIQVSRIFEGDPIGIIHQ